MATSRIIGLAKGRLTSNAQDLEGQTESRKWVEHESLQVHKPAYAGKCLQEISEIAQGEGEESVGDLPDSEAISDSEYLRRGQIEWHLPLPLETFNDDVSSAGDAYTKRDRRRGRRRHHRANILTKDAKLHLLWMCEGNEDYLGREDDAVVA